MSTVIMFGTDIEVNYPAHAKSRTNIRDANRKLVEDALEFAGDIISDNAKMDERFVLIDRRVNQSIIAAFHADATCEPYIDIITFWHGTDIKIAEGEKVFEIEKDAAVKYYEFAKNKDPELQV